MSVDQGVRGNILRLVGVAVATVVLGASAHGAPAGPQLTGIANVGGRLRGYFIDQTTQQPFSLSVGETVGGCRLLRISTRPRRAWLEVHGETLELAFGKAEENDPAGVHPANVARTVLRRAAPAPPSDAPFTGLTPPPSPPAVGFANPSYVPPEGAAQQEDESQTRDERLRSPAPAGTEIAVPVAVSTETGSAAAPEDAPAPNPPQRLAKPTEDELYRIRNGAEAWDQLLKERARLSVAEHGFPGAPQP